MRKGRHFEGSASRMFSLCVIVRQGTPSVDIPCLQIHGLPRANYESRVSLHVNLRVVGFVRRELESESGMLNKIQAYSLLKIACRYNNSSQMFRHLSHIKKTFHKP